VLGGEWIRICGPEHQPTTFGTLGLATGGPVQTNIGTPSLVDARARRLCDGAPLLRHRRMVDGGYSLKHYYSSLPGATPYTPAPISTKRRPASSHEHNNNSGSFNIERFG